VHETRDLQLVGEREGHDGKIRYRAIGFVGGQDLALLARGRDVVGQEGAFGCHAGQGIQLAVDGLEPERRHAHVVGARVAERDGKLGLREQGSLLARKSFLA